MAIVPEREWRTPTLTVSAAVAEWVNARLVRARKALVDVLITFICRRLIRRLNRLSRTVLGGGERPLQKAEAKRRL